MSDDGKYIKTLDLNEWVDNFSTFMADEALKMIRAQGLKKGPEVYKALAVHFMARVLTSTVFDVLNERPVDKLGKKQLLEYNKNAFANFKEDIQEAVAMSFGTALEHYSGSKLEYYCTIKPVPAPLNKEPC